MNALTSLMSKNENTDELGGLTLRKRYIAAATVTLMVVLDLFFGDSAGYLNAWFLIVETIYSLIGVRLLSESHQYIFYQDNLGSAAIPFTWFLFILFHFLLAVVIKNFYEIGYSFYITIQGTAKTILTDEKIDKNPSSIPSSTDSSSA